MITTSDDRNFFTAKEHLSQLSEFSNLFNVQLKIVDVEKDCLLSLEDLSKALCDSKFNQNKEQYEKIKKQC
jgi:hypothetical protein